MIKIILLLIIGQAMGYHLRDSLSEFELQTIPIDIARMEKLESVVYELLNIIKHSERIDVQVDLLNKTRQLDRERNLFLESRPQQELTPVEIEKLFGIGFKVNDIMLDSLIHVVNKMKYDKILINKLIEQLE